MTLLESLQKSREVWVWLAEHPDVSSKWVYFEWAGIPREDQPVNQCYVCEGRLKAENCYECEGGCPIDWTGGIDFPYACEGLEERKIETTDEYNEYFVSYIDIQHETGYSNWCLALPDEDEFRKEAALEIVKLHDEAITKLEEDQDGTDQGTVE